MGRAERYLACGIDALFIEAQQAQQPALTGALIQLLLQLAPGSLDDEQFAVVRDQMSTALRYLNLARAPVSYLHLRAPEPVLDPV